MTGLKWLIPDHQGTNQITVAKDANLTVTQRRQTPYGANRGTAPPSWPDRLGFVGGRNDESGLTQVGARLYDNASGRFLSADPVIDNNDPQQLNGYAYANNSPVTFSDPTGLIRDCGPDGVMCGLDRRMFSGDKDAQQAQHEKEKRSVQSYRRAVQQYTAAVKEVAWDVLKEISGWNDIVDCFTKGDIWGCAGLVAGLVPWGKVGKILEAGWNAIKAVDRLASIVSKAQGVLRRVQGIAEQAARAVTEKFQKTSSGGGSCAWHSFVAGTRVLMADGSTKPISEVKIGGEVKATDPATGETTNREVVGTIVHDDEGDMTKLTVASQDGATGSVDATSWHPVWVDAEGRFVNIGDLKPGQVLTSADGTSPVVTDVDRYTHFEPVYDLTVEGVHTYYVVIGVDDMLVHNCGDNMDFVHGTSAAHADNIEANGLSADGARAGFHGGSLGQPGKLFTYQVHGAGESETLSAAATFARSRTPSGQDSSILIFRTCACIYNRLTNEGHISTHVTDETTGRIEHIFGGGAMPHLELIHRRTF
ncbi:RHS repeat-associated core domain-containing protein [Saccharothrix syringae]|uniref:RHS repeat-associated core domain-containing protein n=1 Tax=Saccharothrix syringae TaxID=103733 RepID=UPI000524B7F0|nr:RHS repeat-associated core domain-containing protein [Saccharothrix syringae]